MLSRAGNILYDSKSDSQTVQPIKKKKPEETEQNELSFAKK